MPLPNIIEIFQTIKKLWSAQEFESSDLEIYSGKKNKKSTESDVTPAGIKSYKFLFVLKNNLFCSIQEIDGLEKWTK